MTINPKFYQRFPIVTESLTSGIALLLCAYVSGTKEVIFNFVKEFFMSASILHHGSFDKMLQHAESLPCNAPGARR